MVEEHDFHAIVRTEQLRFLIDSAQRSRQVSAAHAERAVDEEDESRRAAVRSHCADRLLDSVFRDAEVLGAQGTRRSNAHRHFDQIDVHRFAGRHRSRRDAH